MAVMEGYQFEENLRIWQRPDAEPFRYSDGAEERLLKVLRQASDKSVLSLELLAFQTDWPTLYHLGSSRANLLRPFAGTLLKGAKVLELGCGCGAITRYLGEVAGEVVAVEGSPLRAAVASERCSDLANVTVVADRIQNLPPMPGQFDVVTLIGVLEYCGCYGMTPVQLLALAKSFLKPAGAFILALENRLGLKYFAGVPEDHLGRSWSGITNGYRQGGVETWSRKALCGLLSQAGFVQANQFLAIPDYKMPSCVITTEGLDTPRKIFDPLPLLGGPQRAFEAQALFNLREAWKSIERAGLLLDMADSLCFVAWQAAHPLDGSVLAEYYGNSVHRIRPLAKKLVFVRTPSGVRVERRAVDPGTSREGITQVMEDEPYFLGPRVDDLARDAVMCPGWRIPDLARAYQPWVSVLQDLTDAEDTVAGRYLDLVPGNVILGQDGEPHVFDMEWQQSERIPASFLLLRGLYVSMTGLGPVAVPGPEVSLIFGDLSRAMFALFGREFDEGRLAEYWQFYSIQRRLGWSEKSLPSLLGSRLETMPAGGNVMLLSRLASEAGISLGELVPYVRKLQKENAQLKKSRALLERVLRRERGGE